MDFWKEIISDLVLDAVMKKIVIAGAERIALPFLKRQGLRLASAIKNFLPSKSSLNEDQFRCVLCRLENDTTGANREIVEQAFTSVAGVELIRDNRIVQASEAADVWRPAIRARVERILEDRNADLAVFGQVNISKEALSLWFVPHESDGTLPRGYRRPYEVVNGTLQGDFHEDLHAQIVSAALVAAEQIANTHRRSVMVERDLGNYIKKIGSLLQGNSITEPDRRARLQQALGFACATLGSRKNDAELLEQAAEAFRAALNERIHERIPLEWIGARECLGLTLVILGERTNKVELFEKAANAFRSGLDQEIHIYAPIDWARIKRNLGLTLVIWDAHENDVGLLEQAVEALDAALDELDRERESVPFDWAETQSNLAFARLALGGRKGDIECLELAVKACRKALTVRTKSCAPSLWIETQNHLAMAIGILGDLKRDIGLLEQAINLFREALEEHEHVSAHWVTATQKHHDLTLRALDRLKGRC